MKTQNRNEFGEACSWLPSVPAYLLDQLGVEERRAFEQHRDACALCAARVESHRAVIERLRRMSAAAPESDLVERVNAALPPDAWAPSRLTWWRWARFPTLVRAAASIAAAAGLGGLLAFVVHDRLHEGGRVALTAPHEEKHEAAALAVTHDGTTTPSESEAIGRALAWLRGAQEPGGSWDAAKWGAQKDYTVGVTALALMGCLESSTNGVSETETAIRRGEEYLRGVQGAQGLFGPEVSGALYNHGLATVALLEAYARESNAATRASCERALKYICEAQTPGGGWGYLRSVTNSVNTSIGIWSLQALIRADSLGFPGLQPPIHRGLSWLSSSVNQDGLMGYAQANDYPNGHETLTAAGALCLLKYDRNARLPQLQKMLSSVRRTAARQDMPLDFYRLHFISEVLDLAGDAESRRLLASVRAKLFAMQADRGPTSGSWNASDNWGAVGGRVYATAMATLALQYD